MAGPIDPSGCQGERVALVIVMKGSEEAPSGLAGTGTRGSGMTDHDECGGGKERNGSVIIAGRD